jgi:hypothetical protein
VKNTLELAVNEVAVSRNRPLHRKSNSVWPAVLVTVAIVSGALTFVPVSPEPAEASAITSTSRSYSFDTSNELANQFESSGVSGYATKVTQQLTGGIENSGAISIADAATVETYAVYKAKDGYSLGPVGSKYTFESYFKSFGFVGWGGMGFTTKSALTGNLSGDLYDPYRPTDAIGVSIAGGGFYFHKGGPIAGGDFMSWSAAPAGQVSTPCSNPVHRDQVTTNLGFATVNGSTISCASAEGWYRLILEIERTGEREFKLRAKLWASNSQGVLRSSDPMADQWVTFSVSNSSPFITEPAMFSYFNLSGKRFEKFDGYGVSLSGGATVVQDGFPVVLTSDAAASEEVIRVSGEVKRVSGTVQERGFVYSTTPDPEITDSKVADATANTGAFELASSPVSSGTYYVKAYATDSSNNTSYGVEKTVTITASSSVSAPVANSPGQRAVSPPRTPLPSEVRLSNESNALRVNLGFTGDQGSRPAAYNVLVSPGGATCRVNSEKGFCDIPGIRKGVEYAISITAVNELGSSKPSAVYNRVLLGSSGWLTYATRASLENFAGNSTKLTVKIRSKAKAFARNNPQIDYVSCVGFAAGNVANERQFDLALSRAKRICDQLKKVNPELETNVSSKVPGSAFSGANRKVLVSGYSPIS